MTITLEQAKSLKYRQVLHMAHFCNSDGTPRRWRVNGRVKTWKRTPERVQVPLKHGLYSHTYLHEYDLELYCLTAEDAITERKRLESIKHE